MGRALRSGGWRWARTGRPFSIGNCRAGIWICGISRLDWRAQGEAYLLVKTDRNHHSPQGGMVTRRARLLLWFGVRFRQAWLRAKMHTTKEEE